MLSQRHLGGHTKPGGWNSDCVTHPQGRRIRYPRTEPGDERTSQRPLQVSAWNEAASAHIVELGRASLAVQQDICPAGKYLRPFI